MSSSSSSPRRECQRVSLKEIKKATSNFDERNALGQGGEAKVYRAQIMLGQSEIKTWVAVKHLKPNSPGFEDEIRIMSEIQHPNIVSLLGYCNDSGQKILIYEYMANGSLADYVQKKPTTSLSWEQRLKICLGAALGLKHLHAETKENAKGIIHRDIKPSNILLDANWVAKISDFGMFKLSRSDQINSAMSTTMLKGTRGYFAPEYIDIKNHITKKIDVHAFGVVLFEVLCEKSPWDRGGESYYRKEDEDLGQWARGNIYPEIRREISNDCMNAFTEIINRCLSVNPNNRPMIDVVALTLQRLAQENASKRQAASDAEGDRSTPGGGSAIGDLIPRWMFDGMLPRRDKFYTYDAFIAAAKAFKGFATTGNDTVRKREIAAFLAHTSAATTGGWPTAPDGPYFWGYCSTREEGNPPADYCVPDAQWPCAPGQKYYGRGPIMLSYNYEYGPAGKSIGVDLLKNPDLVATDVVISFKTAFWLWMTPRPPKPSCHAVMTGGWTPSHAERAAGRKVGFGVLTNIIECENVHDGVDDGIGFYKRYCDMLEVGYGDNLECTSQRPFKWIVSVPST